MERVAESLVSHRRTMTRASDQAGRRRLLGSGEHRYRIPEGFSNKRLEEGRPKLPDLNMVANQDRVWTSHHRTRANMEIQNTGLHR